MVGGRRRNPRARQGADVKIGPAAKSFSSRMLGSWLGIARSHRIRGWQGVRPCLLNRSSPRPQLALDLRALIRGFRAPALCDGGTAPGAGARSPPRRKPRGGMGTVWRARLWGFEDRERLASEASAIGDARCFQRKRRWLGVSMATLGRSGALASVAGGLATSRGRRARVPARGWRRRRSRVHGGMRGDGHEVSILTRLGDGVRQGRGPSNVSTMIIRPPQQGQRRAGETSAVWLSASRAGCGAFFAAASS